jgi:F-type H+-transporting ATPase subunit gamma
LTFELIGKKGINYFRKRYTTIAGTHTDKFRNVKFEDAEAIANAISGRFERGEIDAVYMFSNEFKNAMAPTLAKTRILPIELPKAAGSVDYLYEQKPEELLGSLLPRYVKLLVYRAFLESVAAEHAARMTAMTAATSNASDVIDRLTLEMNRVRQASITREIIEIVSGAAALN